MCSYAIQSPFMPTPPTSDFHSTLWKTLFCVQKGKYLRLKEASSGQQLGIPQIQEGPGIWGAQFPVGLNSIG